MTVDCHACGEKLGCVICGEDADLSAYEAEVRSAKVQTANLRKSLRDVAAERDAAVSALARVRELAEQAKRAADEYNASGKHEFAVWPEVDADDILALLPPVVSPEDTNDG